MMDSVPIKYFGDADRANLDQRREKFIQWVEDNESIRPGLVRAAKTIIYKLTKQVPLEAPCLPLDRCVELSPGYVSKAAEVSPQTARNAWLALRPLIGWGELGVRKKIGRVLSSVGYRPRNPGPGSKWGTHIFMFSGLFEMIDSLSFWLFDSGRYADMSFVSIVKKDDSAIVRIIDLNLNNNKIINIKTNSPHYPPKGEMKPRRRKRKPKPWKDPEWKNKTKREKMGIWMNHLSESDARRSQSPEQRKRKSWLLRMSKMPPRMRYGLYIPGEPSHTPEGQMALMLIAEVNASHGNVIQADDPEPQQDDWFGYKLVPKKEPDEGFSLVDEVDMCNEEKKDVPIHKTAWSDEEIQTINLG